MNKLIIIFILFPYIMYSQTKIENNLIIATVEKHSNRLNDLYKYLHQNPEFSMEEKETSKRMAFELRQMGFKVIENIGVYGVVGIFENGKGPVILIRADMDGLPVEEKTNLPYASRVKIESKDGNKFPAMHACGHDVHMTVFIGTAQTLMDLKSKWKGTIVFVAQPAEEISEGSRTMIEDGLFSKIPKPDYILALHASPNLEAGTVGYCPGPVMASVDKYDLTVYGVGGHGAYPHNTIDPIVLSAKIVLDFQTIISREKSPLEPAVLTIGAINGGFRYNIIPDEVKMQITIRTYNEDVRNQIIEAMKRISRGLAMSANLPESKYPVLSLAATPTPPTINNIPLTEHLVNSFTNILGKEKVFKVTPEMAGEDFGRFGRTKDNLPICLFWLGTVDKEHFDNAKNGKATLHPLHSPFFAPQYNLTIQTGVKSMTKAVLDLLAK